MKKFLTHKNLEPQYATLSNVTPVEIAKETPKGWQLKFPSGNTYFHLESRYCLFDTEEQAREHLLKIAEANVVTLKKTMEGWHEVIGRLKNADQS